MQLQLIAEASSHLIVLWSQRAQLSSPVSFSKNQGKPSHSVVSSQALLMQEMGCRLDKSHAYFKERALRELSEQQLAGDLVEKEDLAIPEEGGSSQVSKQ